MKYRNLCLLRRTCHTRLCAAAIRHQPIVEEVPKVPVHAEAAGPEVLEVVDVNVSVQVVIGKFWW